MESRTKPLLSSQQLETICVTHLSDKLESSRELTDGWFNAAFLLCSVNGREAVLKTAPTESVRVMRYEQNLMNIEVEVLRLVNAKTTVPVPRIIAHDKSREIVESDFFLAERVAGKPLDHVRSGWSDEMQDHVDKQVGAYLKEVHTIQGTAFGKFDQNSHNSWSDAFDCLLTWLRQDAIDLDVELPLGAFEAADPLLWSLSEVQAPTLVHWDLWDGNIFVDPEGGAVTGLIDFERALWGDPVIEANFSEPRAAFLDSYGGSILQKPGAGARRLLYDLYLHLIIVIECRFRGFSAEHEAWGRGLLDKTLAKCKALR